VDSLRSAPSLTQSAAAASRPLLPPSAVSSSARRWASGRTREPGQRITGVDAKLDHRVRSRSPRYGIAEFLVLMTMLSDSERGVVDDPVKPGAHVEHVSPARERRPGAEHRLLDDVLGVIRSRRGRAWAISSRRYRCAIATNAWSWPSRASATKRSSVCERSTTADRSGLNGPTAGTVAAVPWACSTATGMRLSPPRAASRATSRARAARAPRSGGAASAGPPPRLPGTEV